MRVAVSTSTCEGTGYCTQLCPEVFSLRDDGKATVDEAAAEAASISDLQEAATMCPTSAIRVDERRADPS